METVATPTSLLQVAEAEAIFTPHFLRVQNHCDKMRGPHRALSQIGERHLADCLHSTCSSWCLFRTTKSQSGDMQVTENAECRGIDLTLDIAARLEEARSRLEERFLEGGDVLATTVQSVGRMVATLEDVMKAMDRSRVDMTIADLVETARNLLALPEAHARRGAELASLTEITNAMTEQVDEMLVIIRFLRSFTTTVKVTGAGAEGFDAFANEMLGEINEARRQADRFQGTLECVCGGIQSASAANAEVDTAYKQVVPGLAAALTGDATRFGEYHARIRGVAGELTALVRGIQSKMGRALSALQVGDITRQRVEHVQTGLALLRDGAAEKTLVPAEMSLYLRLLALQTDDLLTEFQDGCNTVMASLSGLAADTKELLVLGKTARGSASAGGEGFLGALEGSVTRARQLVSQVESTAERLQSVCDATGSTARDLALSVDHIQAIETKIQHMAINTSLRCSRMGEAGKPINVVATELRAIAGQMEVVSGRLLATLRALEEKSTALVSNGETSSGLGEQLDRALASISEAGGKISRDLGLLAERGDGIARDVTRDVSGLDFTRDIGPVLAGCARDIEDHAASLPGPDGDIEEPSEELLDLADKLYAAYTMARERQIHGLVFAPPVASAGPAATAADDDLDAAFF